MRKSPWNTDQTGITSGPRSNLYPLSIIPACRHACDPQSRCPNPMRQQLGQWRAPSGESQNSPDFSSISRDSPRSSPADGGGRYQTSLAGGGGGFSDVLPSIASPTDKASISMIAVHDNAVIGTLCPYYCYLHGRFRCRDVCRMVPPPRIYRRLYRTVACMCTVPTYNCPSRQVVKCLGRMESATYSRRSFRFRSVGVSSSWILSSFEGPGVIRSRRTCYHGCPHKNQEYSRTAERGSP